MHVCDRAWFGLLAFLDRRSFGGVKGFLTSVELLGHILRSLQRCVCAVRPEALQIGLAVWRERRSLALPGNWHRRQAHDHDENDKTARQSERSMIHGDIKRLLNRLVK